MIFPPRQRIQEEALFAPPPGMDVLWRATVIRYSVTIDAEREEYGTSDPYIRLDWIEVIRRTPKGAWIRSDDTMRFAGPTDKEAPIRDLSFVRLTANKAYARNTGEEALQDLIERRKRQIRILEGQLLRASDEKKYAERALGLFTKSIDPAQDLATVYG